MSDPVQESRSRIIAARKEGKGALLKEFTKQSGPGWLQSAITLGGGSLAGGLYLGVLAGYNLMWLQMLAMILGIVMLSAIAYVTLSTGERPFQAINRHINPVLGWSWAIAVMMANIVWCLPQFALGTAAVQQNLAPDLLSGKGGTVAICLVLLGVGTSIIWTYGTGSKGVVIFERILKVFVGFIVLAFIGVVVTLASSPEGLPFAKIAAGFVPDFSLFSRISPDLVAFVEASSLPDWWTERIMKDQRNVMVTAVATAVGINMTFLLPYSMLKKGWDKEFRGMAVCDLSMGLFIPFLLATSCVVIAASSQFHGKFDQTIIDEGTHAAYVGTLNAFSEAKLAADGIPVSEEALTAVKPAVADQQLAAMLIRRDAFSLAKSLEPLTGSAVSQYVFGFGVLAMALSTIIILMLINGFTLCEMLNKPGNQGVFRVGCLISGVVGFFGPFLWSGQAKFWLAVPTSTFGMMLLPIAYLTFFLMMNSQKLLGDAMPRGGSRIAWNVAMSLALAFAIYGAYVSIMGKTAEIAGMPTRNWAFIIYLGLFVAGLAVHFKRKGGKTA